MKGDWVITLWSIYLVPCNHQNRWRISSWSFSKENLFLSQLVSFLIHIYSASHTCLSQIFFSFVPNSKKRITSIHNKNNTTISRSIHTNDWAIRISSAQALGWCSFNNNINTYGCCSADVVVVLLLHATPTLKDIAGTRARGWFNKLISLVIRTILQRKNFLT